ncbi:hypothetical protein NMY22_g18621 [Coprinellus aureogranulatus]|nr:hypothetical protein NMY22_g18621 [Coprinellus aureogranulatus]
MSLNSNAMVRTIKRLGPSALWQSSLGAFLLSVWVLFRSNQQKVSKLETVITELSAKLNETERALEERQICTAALPVEERIRLSENPDTLQVGRDDQEEKELTGMENQIRQLQTQLLHKDNELAALKQAKDQSHLMLQEKENDAGIRRSSLYRTIGTQTLQRRKRVAQGQTHNGAQLEKKDIQVLSLENACASEHVQSHDSGRKPPSERTKNPPAEKQFQTTPFDSCVDPLNHPTVALLHTTIAEKDEALAKLSGTTIELEKACKSLSMANQKQLERLEEMESTVRAVMAMNEQLVDDRRARQIDDLERDNFSLQNALDEAKEDIATAEKKMKELEAKIDLKEQELRSLAQASLVLSEAQEEASRKCTEDHEVRNARPTRAGHHGSKSQMPLEESGLLSMNDRAHYEETIAQLRDKLAECHGLLRDCGRPMGSEINPPWQRVPRRHQNPTGGIKFPTIHGDLQTGPIDEVDDLDSYAFHHSVYEDVACQGRLTRLTYSERLRNLSRETQSNAVPRNERRIMILYSKEIRWLVNGFDKHKEAAVGKSNSAICGVREHSQLPPLVLSVELLGPRLRNDENLAVAGGIRAQAPASS